MTVVDGIDTVHVASVNLTLLGHTPMEVRAVLSDMHEILEHDAAPEQRLALSPTSTPDGRRFWTMAR